MDTLIIKTHTLFTNLHRPLIDNFELWLELMQTPTNPEYFWKDLNFFHLYEEDFFDWYRNDDFKEWLWRRLN